jgi:hypothetical protein
MIFWANSLPSAWSQLRERIMEKILSALLLGPYRPWRVPGGVNPRQAADD